jgi:branched-chain amino acid transport system permease protein
MSDGAKVWLFHGLVLAAVFAAQFVLPSYHATNLSRIMVLAVFAMGYNLAFGYTGLLSLGHALFFAAGMYGMGLPIWHLEWLPLPALIAGLVAGGGLAALVGVLALRTAGVSFMIVTLMFAQAGYLTLLYLNTYTGGDEGFVVASAARSIGPLDLAADGTRFRVAFALFAVALLLCLWLVRSPFGRVMIAMRENEERSRMLGYDPFRVKMAALVLSGIYAGMAGAAYGLMFGYVGATFATIQYSILPMLYVLLGGAGTVLGPFLGALVMFYLVDITSGYTGAYLFVVGAALVAVVLFAPKGILGTIRERFAPWLP